jgi:hypothetical protein
LKCKWQKKSGQSLQNGLGWLTGLIDKVLSYNMGHSLQALCWLSGTLVVCIWCKQYYCFKQRAFT